MRCARRGRKTRELLRGTFNLPISPNVKQEHIHSMWNMLSYNIHKLKKTRSFKRCIFCFVCNWIQGLHPFCVRRTDWFEILYFRASSHFDMVTVMCNKVVSGWLETSWSWTTVPAVFIHLRQWWSRWDIADWDFSLYLQYSSLTECKIKQRCVSYCLSEVYFTLTHSRNPYEVNKVS